MVFLKPPFEGVTGPWSDPGGGGGGGGLWGLKPPPFNLMIFIILSSVVHVT